MDNTYKKKEGKKMVEKCPLIGGHKQKEYKMTDEEVLRFCRLGCSADCDMLLKEYADKLKERKAGKEFDNHIK